MLHDLPNAKFNLEQTRIYEKTILFSDVMKQITSLSDMIIWDMESGEVSDSTVWTYSSRVYAVHSWYIRASHANKRRFMLNLMDRINKMETLCCIMRAIWLALSKDSIYNQQWNKVFMLYDQVPLDSNRMAIPDKLLMKNFRLDLKWFDTLNHACQVRLILGLVPLSGGPIVREMAQMGRFILANRHAHRKLSRISGDEELFQKKPTTRLTATKKFPHVTETFWNNLNETRKVNAKQHLFEEAIKDLRKELKMDISWKTKHLIMRMASTPKVPYKSTAYIHGHSVAHAQMDMLQQLPFKVLLNIRKYLSPEDRHNLTKLNSYWTCLWDIIQNCEDVREAFVKQLPVLSGTDDLMTTRRKKKTDKKSSKSMSKGDRKSTARKELEESFLPLPVIKSVQKMIQTSVILENSRKAQLKKDSLPEIISNSLHQKKRELMRTYTFKQKPKDIGVSRAKGASYLREQMKVKGCMDKSIYAWCAKLLKVEGFEVASTGFEILKAPDKLLKMNNHISKVQEEVKVHYFPRYSLIERPILNTTEKVFYRSLENRRLRPNDVRRLENFFPDHSFLEHIYPEHTISKDESIVYHADSYTGSLSTPCTCCKESTITSND